MKDCINYFDVKYKDNKDSKGKAKPLLWYMFGKVCKKGKVQIRNDELLSNNDNQLKNKSQTQRKTNEYPLEEK